VVRVGLSAIPSNVGIPALAVSAHLRLLAHAEVHTARYDTRSEADGAPGSAG